MNIPGSTSNIEQYLRLAPPAIDALRAIGAAADSTIIVSHEFMGMPTALSAIMEPGCNFKTAFYAHEVATMRRIIEEHPGHDTMFYNAINHNHGKTKYASCRGFSTLRCHMRRRRFYS
ncbi:MAG: hypothetical protein ACYS71_02095 [Planctomycetota bacterium]